MVGRALKIDPARSVVVATKIHIHRNDEWWTPERVVASLDNSLRLLGTDYVDVFNLHAVEAHEYDYALNTLAPALVAQKEKGKIRHIGLTENPIVDFTNEALKRAVHDSVWEVFMVGFHMMHQGARNNVFPFDAAKGHRHADHVRGAQHLCRSAARRPRDEGACRQGFGREIARRHRRSARLPRPRRAAPPT